MSVGGIVLEVMDCGDRMWINTKGDYKDTCGIYVEKNPKSLCVEPGDCVWWQGNWALWTPRRRGEKIGPHDICIKKIGYSGITSAMATVRRELYAGVRVEE